MENKLSKAEIADLKIVNLLNLIARCDEMIENMLLVDKPDAQSVRQERYIKHRYCEELTAIFQSLNAKIHVVENNLKQAA